MNQFVCALRLDGAPIGKPELFAPLARLPRDLDYESCYDGAFASVAAQRKAPGASLVARCRGLIGVGDVRLDNREELERTLCASHTLSSDLQVVLAFLDRCGADAIPRILGDFCFVVWDASAQKLLAARDAFGVKPLFYRRTSAHVLFSSRLEPLCGDSHYDTDYIADFVIGLPGPSTRTIWQNTLQIEPGSVLVQRGSVTTQTRYWSASDYEPNEARSDACVVAEFKDLFFSAVRTRISQGETWAQLSGGLDSSAVVSAAEWQSHTCGGAGLNGTVSILDSLGSGDESRFCDTVTSKFGLKNSVVRDYWPWRNTTGSAPAPSDEPSPLYPFFARDERMVDNVVQAGGRVLLSGLGSDHYMFGTLAYMADMAVRGAIASAAREVMGWAMQSRRSFWHTARAHVLQPIIHSKLRSRGLQSPTYLRTDFASAHRIMDRLAEMRSPRAELGSFFQTHTATEMRRVSNWVQRGPFQDKLEMRYPFLDRRLVEFTLQLPVNMRIRPEGRKWILREAMRGVMPETVRTRMHKGGMDARILWTFERERRLIDALLTNPILGEIGCVDVVELRRTAESARQGEWRNTVQILSVLALESWLRAREGVWPMEAAATQSAA